MNTNTKPGERPQILGPTELVQALREKHAGGWRLSYRAAMRVVQEQYDFRRAAALSSPHPEAREEDIKTIREALYDMETAFNYKTYHDLEGRGSMNRNEKEYFAAQEKILTALSRLAAPKDEEQDRTGETVVFDNNAIPYGQDMQFYTGVPAHIRFAVTRINDERYKLTAPGYGGEPYGNGAIYVKASDLPAAPDPRPAEEPKETPLQRKIVEVYNRESDGRKGE